MPLKSGDLRHRVRFERLDAGTNDYGEEVGAWAALTETWCQVIYGRGQERREAAQEAGSVPATFRVRRSPITAALTPKDRLRFDPAGGSPSDSSPAWDIHSVVPLGLDGIEITAVMAA